MKEKVVKLVTENKNVLIGVGIAVGVGYAGYRGYKLYQREKKRLDGISKSFDDFFQERPQDDDLQTQKDENNLETHQAEHESVEIDPEKIKEKMYENTVKKEETEAAKNRAEAKNPSQKEVFMPGDQPQTKDEYDHWFERKTPYIPDLEKLDDIRPELFLFAIKNPEDEEDFIIDDRLVYVPRASEKRLEMNDITQEQYDFSLEVYNHYKNRRNGKGGQSA